jgi:alkanesulfonate monooxygenase SsuD/methylene tetrahydromethanopterin reductase-like flavin-dependent oxidoreductase (luciferase family)
MEVGVILGDQWTSVPPREHMRGLLAQVEAAQRNGFTLLTLGQHYVYPDVRWLQPIPTLARISAELERDVRVATTIVIVPLYHPIQLAEDLATLDIVSDGRLVVGAGLGYRPEEFAFLGLDIKERAARFEEALEVMARLWTEDSVTHHGRFWQFADAPVHIKPIQQPHMPLWVGAQSDIGVKRAARLGQAWTIPPSCTVEEVEGWIDLFQRTRDEHGLPRVRSFPLRREVSVGRDRADALALYERNARGRYVAYAQRGRTWAGTPEELTRTFTDTVAGHLVAGTAEDVVAELTAIAERLPVGPLIFRASWPDMSTEEVVATLDRLGREVVPALRAIPGPPEA